MMFLPIYALPHIPKNRICPVNLNILFLLLVIIGGNFGACQYDTRRVELSRIGNLVKSFKDEVAAENFTYYVYNSKNVVPTFVVLETIEGDADLYVSSKVKNPTYYDYDIKSTTCGEDIVDITELKPPIYIGVYGAHGFTESSYVLYIYRVPLAEDLMNYQEENDGSTYSTDPAYSEHDPEEHHSFIWDVISFLFKLLIEILL